MPGFDYPMNYMPACPVTVFFHQPGYPLILQIPSLSQGSNVGPSSPAKPNTNPSLSDETAKFKYKPRKLTLLILLAQ